MDLMKEIAGITDIKCDCTLQELTGYINTLAVHFGGGCFSEEDVLEALRELEEDDESDVVLVRANPGTGYPIDYGYPWCAIHTRTPPKFVPLGYDNVPG